MNTNSLQKISDISREYDAGYRFSYTQGGEPKTFNMLDYATGLNYRQAQKEEAENRMKKHITEISVFVLSMVIVSILLIIAYISSLTNITGVYCEKSGKKIEVRHNKYWGLLDFTWDENGQKIRKSGKLGKINNRYYGVYLNDEVLGKYTLVAYADVRDRSINWQNNKWKLGL